jgi:hypothetical protein
MRSRNFRAAGDGTVVGVLQVLVFERADIACGINRRRGMPVRRDAARDRPPASRRTVYGTLFVAGIRSESGAEKFELDQVLCCSKRITLRGARGISAKWNESSEQKYLSVGRAKATCPP